jgi:hypothetical protein
MTPGRLHPYERRLAFKESRRVEEAGPIRADRSTVALARRAP